MKIDRRVLSRHIDKVTCGGQIEGAVFTGAFVCRALSPDQLLYVKAPALPDLGEELGEPLGVPLLQMWQRALTVVAAAANGEDKEGEQKEDLVEVRVDGPYLVVDEGPGGVLRLLTAAPSTIGTWLNEKDFLAVEQKFPDTEPVEIPARLRAGIRDTFSLLKADEIELTVSPDGTGIRVGHENTNQADFTLPALKGEEEYKLLFGEHVVDVLAAADSEDTVTVRAGGPSSPVLIAHGGYQYLLGPRSRGAGQ